MLRTTISNSSRRRLCLSIAAPRQSPHPRGPSPPLSSRFNASSSSAPSCRRSFASSSSSSSSSSNQSHWNDARRTFSSTTTATTRDAGLSLTSVISDPKNEVPGPQNIPSRSEQIRRLQQQADTEYDLLVVGGGATGAGIALDAAARNIKVACVERGDFASETSSRSTKLIWAGLKYFGTATSALLSVNLFKDPKGTIGAFMDELHLVLHCHQERQYMTSQQRHLTSWMPIVVPFTSWYVSPPPLGHPLFGFFPVVAPIVFKLYDALSSFSCPPSYIMSKNRAKQVFPTLGVDDKHINYCAVFYEAIHNDARTNIAIALTAAERGAHIANYVEVVDLIQSESSKKIIGAKVVDRMTGKSWVIRAKKVVLAGGPFTDSLRQMEADKDQGEAVRGGSGTHIVLPGHFLPKDMGMLDVRTSDGRFLFMLPWQGHTLVGTTDKTTPAKTLPTAPEEEIQWLVQEFQKYLRSDVKVKRSDVLSSWRGWRPLAVDPNAAPGGPVSRDHIISENPDSGVVFIAGGKWTTWRLMAEEVTNRVVGPNGPKCSTLQIKLHGGEGYTDSLKDELIQKYGMDASVAQHLVNTYGVRAVELCELSGPTGANWHQFGKLLVEGFPYLEGEVIYACREYACTIEDVLSRRTRLAFLNKQAALDVIPRVADIMAKELGWSRKVKSEQMTIAKKYIDSYGGRDPLVDEA